MTTLRRPSGVRELARALGIHPSSVSRALAGKSGVSAELRRQVTTAAQGMDYAPNPHASSLRRNCGEGLALITAYQQPHIASLRNNALMSLGRTEYGGVRVLTRSPDESLDALVRLAVSQFPRAIVVAGYSGEVSRETRQQLSPRRIPLICMDGLISGFDAVVIRRWIGTYQATRLLLLSGCRYPVFFSAAPPTAPDERLKGIFEAYRSLNQRPDHSAIIPFASKIDFSYTCGYTMTRDLLRTRPVDGIFCFNDEIAVGVLKALSDAGLSVPGDVKIVGFDNLPIAEYTSPSLTTVAQPVTEVARATLEMLARRLVDPELPPQLESFEARLVIRQSAAPVSRRALEKIFKLSSKTTLQEST